jgi:hypothetical protein
VIDFSLYKLKMTKESTSYLIGLIMALIVAISILLLAKEPSKFGFSITFGALTFLLFVFLFRGTDEVVLRRFSFKDKFGLFSPKVLVAILYLVCLLLVLFIPSNTGTQFVSWLSIPAQSYVRLFAGVLVSSILPGYGLLQLIDRKKHFKGLAQLVSSFLISVFLMGALSFVSFLFNWELTSIFWLSVIVNVVIFVSYSLLQLKSMVLSSENRELQIKLRIEHLIILCIFLFFIVGWIAYYSSYQLGSTGDMWDHYYTVLRVAKGGLFSSTHLSYLNAETWFSFHFLTLFQLTGFPSLNGWMIYAFINFFFILAFYLMVRVIVGENHPQVPIISTVIATLFAGFGWLVALSGPGADWGTSLAIAGNWTYNDIIYSFIYGPIPQYLSLSVLFVLIYLMFKKDEFSIASAILTVILVAEGLLIHSPEIIFFVLFYYIYLLFAKTENFGRLKRFNISILIGLLTVFIIGLAFPSHFYFNMNILLPALFLAIALSFLRFRFRNIKLRTPSFSIPKYVSILVVCLLWVLYIISFFAWNDTKASDIPGILGAVGLKPWYIYPISSGISLLLGLIGLSYLLLSNRAKLANAKYLVILLLSIFLIGKMMSYVNVNLITAGTYWEKRLYGSFMIIPLSIIGAFLIVELFTMLRFKQLIRKVKKPFFALLSGLIICVIVVNGIGSSVLALDYVSITAQTDPLASCSQAEIQGLDYLRANASAGSAVLGLSEATNRLGFVFSGLNHLTSPFWFSDFPFQYIDTTNPELFLKMLYSLGINYLFATNSDLAVLSPGGYFSSGLRYYFPVDYNNSEVTIFSVPQLNPPSTESNLTLVLPEYMLNDTLISSAGILANRTFNLPIDMLSLSGLDYCLKFSGDGSVFNSRDVILSSDRGWSSEQLSQYVSWVKSGGNLVVLNTDGLGSFADRLSISSKPNSTAIINKATNNVSSVPLSNMSASELYSQSPRLNVIANYFDENKRSVPLAFSLKEGLGEIFYLNIKPLFDVLSSNNESSWDYFRSMGSLFGLLDLQTSAFQNTPADSRWKYIGYDSTLVRDYAQLEGNISVISSSIIIPYKEFEVGTLTLTNVSGTANGLPISQTVVMKNITISNLIEEGSLNTLIESKEGVDFYPSNYGRYSLLLLRKQSDISLQVPPQGISFSINGTYYGKRQLNIVSGNILLQNLTASMSSSIVTNLTISHSQLLENTVDNRAIILAHVPVINNTGLTFLPKVSVPNYIRYVSNESFNGSLGFNFDCSSNSIIVLNNFWYSQPAQQSSENLMLRWEITAVPWESILTSPIFLFLAALLIIVIFALQSFYQISFSLKIGKRKMFIKVDQEKEQ